MKKIGKIIKWLLVVVVVLIGLLLLAPVVFDDDIQAAIKEVVNEELNAEVDWKDYSLTIFEDFPNLTFEMDEISVDGVDTFANVRLAGIEKMLLTIDLGSVFGDTYKISKVGVYQPNLHVKVLENGTANYDIAKADTAAAETVTEEPAGEPTAFTLKLDEFHIREANIIYDDAAGNMLLEIKNLNHDGTGTLAEQYILNTLTTIEGITFDFEHVRYMNQTSLEMKADLEMDMEHLKFAFKENTLKLNELALGFDGWLAMPGDNIDMDLSFEAKETAFKHLLSMVPAVYARDFADIKTSGEISLKGFAKGTHNESNMPGFGLDLMVDDARFQYPDLPKAVEDINVNVHVARNDGPDLDNMEINVSRFDLSMAQAPVSMHLNMTHPISDPDIDAGIQAQVDLASIKEFMPLEEGEEYTGKITADITLAGRVSALEEERYEEFDAHGQLIVMDMLYHSKGMAYDTELKTMYLNFSPQQVELSNFDAQMGKSDIQANGTVDNLLPYALDDQTLRGKFEVTSKYIDLGELMAEDQSATATTTSETESNIVTDSTEAYGVVEIPKNLDFDLQVDVLKLRYPYEDGVDLDMENVRGNILTKDGVATMHGVNVDMMGGNITMEGNYDTKDASKPAADFVFDIVDWDITQTGTTFNSIEKIAPIMKSATGKFSTGLKMSTLLDQNMEPVYSSLTGDGDLTSKDIFFENIEVFNRIGQELKSKRFSKQNLEDVKMKYEFKDGKVFVEPFDVKMGKTDANIRGWSSFEQELDYVIGMKIPRSELGSSANEVVEGLVGQLNAKGTNFSVGDVVDVDARITGLMTDPKVKIALAGMGENAVENIKEQVKEQVEEKIEEVKEEAIDKACEEAKQIVADAQVQADKVNADAAKLAASTKSEGYAQADQLVMDAGKNPIKKKAAELAAKKLKKETDKKAQQILDTAKAKSDQIIVKAQAKADAKCPQ